MDVLKGKAKPILSHDSPAKSEGHDYKSFMSSLSSLDRLAVHVTNKVGSVGFFLVILIWTVGWTGYNVIATETPTLHLKPFDPFPAFVAYLLMSNVIQILLMPLIMVGQNLEARRTEQQALKDFYINQRTEKELRITEAEVTHTINCLETILQHMSLQAPERVHHLKHEEDVPVKISED